jgi:hypothetical protein
MLLLHYTDCARSRASLDFLDGANIIIKGNAQGRRHHGNDKTQTLSEPAQPLRHK